MGLIGLMSLGNLGIISLVGSSASSTHQFICLIGFVIAAKIISWGLKLKQEAALGVATVQLSAAEIANAASLYYLIASSFHVHLLVRETMWW